MMYIIAAIAWVLVWVLAGYFTIGAILVHIERKRAEKAWAAYIQHQRLMMRNTGKYTTTHFSSNPFDDLLKKDDLA